jgi:hypothetical protein
VQRFVLPDLVTARDTVVVEQNVRSRRRGGASMVWPTGKLDKSTPGPIQGPDTLVLECNMEQSGKAGQLSESRTTAYGVCGNQLGAFSPDADFWSAAARCLCNYLPLMWEKEFFMVQEHWYWHLLCRSSFGNQLSQRIHCIKSSRLWRHSYRPIIISLVCETAPQLVGHCSHRH